MTVLDNILSGLTVLLLIALGVVLVMNANLRADLAIVNANAVMLGRANIDLKNAAVKQNNAITAMQVLSEAKTRAADKAIKEAAIQAQHATDEVTVIARQPTAAKTDCEAATHIFQSYLKGR